MRTMLLLGAMLVAMGGGLCSCGGCGKSSDSGKSEPEKPEEPPKPEVFEVSMPDADSTGVDGDSPATIWYYTMSRGESRTLSFHVHRENAPADHMVPMLLTQGYLAHLEAIEYVGGETVQLLEERNRGRFRTYITGYERICEGNGDFNLKLHVRTVPDVDKWDKESDRISLHFITAEKNQFHNIKIKILP